MDNLNAPLTGSDTNTVIQPADNFMLQVQHEVVHNGSSLAQRSSWSASSVRFNFKKCSQRRVTGRL
jgi:hypothetical protein